MQVVDGDWNIEVSRQGPMVRLLVQARAAGGLQPDLPPAQARRLAAALVAVAEEVESDGREGTDDR